MNDGTGPGVMTKASQGRWVGPGPASGKASQGRPGDGRALSKSGRREGSGQGRSLTPSPAEAPWPGSWRACKRAEETGLRKHTRLGCDCRWKIWGEAAGGCTPQPLPAPPSCRGSPTPNVTWHSWPTCEQTFLPLNSAALGMFSQNFTRKLRDQQNPKAAT